MLDNNKLFVLGFGIHASIGADIGVLEEWLIGVVDVLPSECLHLIKL